jgi:hypothetical protein
MEEVYPKEYDVILRDEIPRFKSGHRKVTVLSLGPVWAHLQCGRKKAKIRRDRWVQIVADTARFHHRNNPTR